MVSFTQVFDSRQHVGCEVCVWGDLPFRWSNADVGLVDPQAAGLLWPRVDLLERKPELDGKSTALNKKHCFKCSWLGWGSEDFPCVYATTSKSNKDFAYVKNKRQMGFEQLEKNKKKPHRNWNNFPWWLVNAQAEFMATCKQIKYTSSMSVSLIKTVPITKR